MRAIVLLCLLHGAFVESQFEFTWNISSGRSDSPSPEAQPVVCLADQTTCGCCLMQKKMQRMEEFFKMNVDGLSKNLTNSKTALNDLRASRSAFSVALNYTDGYNCFGPFAEDKVIPYTKVFLNLGGGYSAQTGTFTAPRSGVYGLAVTVFSNGAPVANAGTAANLMVNGYAVTSLQENNGPDREDSATAVVSVKLKAGDAVAVVLPRDYVVCDDRSQFNTFTGFLLYPV